jgi:hypothetical protein
LFFLQWFIGTCFKTSEIGSYSRLSLSVGNELKHGDLKIGFQEVVISFLNSKRNWLNLYSMH